MEDLFPNLYLIILTNNIDIGAVHEAGAHHDLLGGELGKRVLQGHKSTVKTKAIYRLITGRVVYWWSVMSIIINGHQDDNAILFIIVERPYMLYSVYFNYLRVLNADSAMLFAI